MKIKLYFLSILPLCFLCLSCGKEQNQSARMTPIQKIKLEDIGQKLNETPIIDRKLIKSGILSIKSKEIDKTKLIINTFALRCHGYTTNESLSSYQQNSCYNLTINIEASKFDYFVFLIDSSKMEITSRDLKTEDVTMKYVDDSSRLANKRILEKTYLNLLSKSNKMSDILIIEAKIEEIRSDIESRENQLKALDNQIEYSEFKITIFGDKDEFYRNNNSFLGQVINGLGYGWDVFKIFLIYLITIWPLYIIVFVIYLLIIWIRKIIRKRSKINEE